mgnify:CR=1 FL=1
MVICATWNTAGVRIARGLAAIGLAATLAACGGGGGGDDAVASDAPATREEAARFLTQATFGPTSADVDRVMRIGYERWIDEQLARAPSSHRELWEAADRTLKASDPNASAGQEGVLNAFWRHAVTGRDQLRLRHAYALSQIFVISMVDGTVGDNPRAVAAWLDMLNQQGVGTYRQLLESVSRHPMMGVYLSHLRNQKANAATGRVPDENYAREVMQLFSIGIVELDEDGRPRLVDGKPVETYTPADISGLAKVFTGWSWACVDTTNNCFYNGSNGGQSDPDRSFKPMVGYANFHSTEAKTFLGMTIPAQTTADPQASLTAALDAIANHPNVGPFVARQLIQRLVTSNPSPAYVRDVARVFADNGKGVRGDLKAVLKAVLLHPEARAMSDTSGKVREPVLRLSAYLRAFPHTSDTGRWRVGNTDNPGTSLGQSPMRSPSVFNFFRPGYVPPGTYAAAAGLVVPEMQIAHETTAAGYVNFMRNNLQSGAGLYNGTIDGVTYNRNDLRPDFTAELALADQPAALVDHVVAKLTYGSVSQGLKETMTAAVASITVPVPNGSNQSSIDTAKLNRVRAAILLVLASPEFLVQR